MALIPAKVAARFAAGLKRFQPILASAKSRDVNESDTVVLVADMLCEVFGYDKYEEITSEHAIKGTYCDLAIKLAGTLVLLVEVKAIGLELKDAFVKQAIDYAANQGADWVVLTSGVQWRIYKVIFGKPLDQELLAEFNFLDLNAKDEDDLCLLWLLAKESWQKEALADYHAQRQALSRFTLGALILSTPVLDVIKRELRRVSPDIRIRTEEVEAALSNEVLKRDILEGEKANVAKKLVAKSAKVQLRSKADKSEAAPNEETVAEPVEPPPPAPTPERNGMVRFECPSCQKQLKAPHDCVGRKAKCGCEISSLYRQIVDSGIARCEMPSTSATKSHGLRTCQ